MAKISIIMPLYNADRFLEEALQSICGQTFTDYELICINDASTDDTLEILHRFHRQDGRIQIFTNAERRGAAFSRNRGMREATGEYLAFLDGDDIFDETMLEKAYYKIEETAADIAIFAFRHVLSSDIHNKLRVCHGEEFQNRYCHIPFSVTDCNPYEVINWGSGPWNKLYRRSFIEKNHLAFQDLPCANDIYFVNMALMLARRLIVLETENVMVYVRDHSGTDRISCHRDPMCNFKALMQLGQELVKRGKFGELCSCFYARVFFSLQSALVADKKEAYAKAFYLFLQEEGIQKICSLDNQWDMMAEPYVRDALFQFKEKSYASGWYKEKNILSFYLEQEADKVIRLFTACQKAGKKIAIWGAGENGKTILQFCLRHGLLVDAVIDKSRKKQGSKLCGYTVFLPQDAMEKIQVIIVSARYISDAVEEEIGQEEKEVIDMNQFLCLY